MPPMNELQSYEYQMFLVKGEIYWIRHNCEFGQMKVGEQGRKIGQMKSCEFGESSDNPF